MADTRQHDLEYLVRMRQNAPNAFWRDKADQIIDRIMRENGAVRERREKLVMALRNNDLRAIKRFEQELQNMRADETYGKDY